MKPVIGGSLDIPFVPLGSVIPKMLHQTYPTPELPPHLQANADYLKANNPNWRYCFYSDSDIEKFITENFGPSVMRRYISIDGRYGAARADLFRYLLMYKLGGAYLDIKSRFNEPIDRVIRGDEGYVLSRWRNKPGEVDAGAGLHAELSHLPGGEFQQWHIIASPGHPFLRAVICRVLANIDHYGPWRFGVGRPGVLRTTGPIAYTLAIAPLLQMHPCKIVSNETVLGLEYSISRDGDHRDAFKTHYTRLDSPVVNRSGIASILGTSYIAARRLKHWWQGTQAKET